jgi:uncharacterized protein YrrD
MSSPEEPQVAWKAIEEGAHVFSAEGQAVGKVSRVVGDADADVFTGLAIKLGPLGNERFVPSERVSAIWADRVDIDLPESTIEKLPEHEDAPAVRWEPSGPSFLKRLFGRR